MRDTKAATFEAKTVRNYPSAPSPDRRPIHAAKAGLVRLCDAWHRGSGFGRHAVVALILIFVVGIVVCLETPLVLVSWDGAQKFQIPAETSLHGVAVRISVIDCPNKIQSSPSVQDVAQFFGGQHMTIGDCLREGHASNQFLWGMKFTPSRPFLIVGWPLWQLAISWDKDSRQIKAMNEGARIAPINNIQSNNQFVVSSKMGVGFSTVSGCKPNSLEPQSRSMSRKKFVSSKFDGFISDAPKFFGGVPQSASEDRQNHGKDANNRFSMLVQKVDYSDQCQKNRTSQGGAFLLFLGICTAVGIGSYWMARYQR